MNNKPVPVVLDDILFQLHVISSQNFTALAQTLGEDPMSEQTRRYAFAGLEREKEWMAAFQANRSDGGCPSGTGS